MGPIRQDESSMAPGFLVASPRLDGSVFERSVILLVHHDAHSAMGYMVNKPVEVDFGTLIVSVNQALEPQILPERFDKTVYFGGPVRIEQLWVLFRGGGAHPKGADESGEEFAEFGPFDEPGHLTFGDAWTLSGAGDVIEDFAIEPTDDYFMPVLGYAGWGAGQLEGEIEEGSWLMADFDEDLICNTPPGQCWQKALDQIGVDPTAFMMMGKVGSA